MRRFQAAKYLLSSKDKGEGYQRRSRRGDKGEGYGIREGEIKRREVKREGERGM